MSISDPYYPFSELYSQAGEGQEHCGQSMVVARKGQLANPNCKKVESEHQTTHPPPYTTPAWLEPGEAP